SRLTGDRAGRLFSEWPSVAWRHSPPTYRPVSRRSQPPCDTRHEGAPATKVRRGFDFRAGCNAPASLLVIVRVSSSSLGTFVPLLHLMHSPPFCMRGGS